LHDALTVISVVKAEGDVTFTLMAYDSKGAKSEIYSCTGATLAYSFDPISLAVYRDSQEFRIEINAPFEFSVESLSVCEVYEEDALTTEPTVNIVEPMEDGKNGVYVLRPDGIKELIPTVPNKGIIMGNSLVLGMFNSFGMCASAMDKDYFYYVTTEIRKYNPDFECARLHGSGFEHSENSEMYSKWFYEDPNPGTGKPTYLSFTPDVDFIIIQITDNVNTEEKMAFFNSNIDGFIAKIKTMCPKARVIFVHGWYNYLRTNEKVAEICDKYSIERVCIRDLYTVKNQARNQPTATRPDGTVIDVPDRWITHPGDLGMKKIADRLISVIKLA
jgi:hypothetical protein